MTNGSIESRPRNWMAKKRADIVREKVVEALLTLSPDDPFSARLKFCGIAVQRGKQLGMRVWEAKPGSRKTPQELALAGLMYLLGERTWTSPNGQIYGLGGGTNVGWVLDLWEAAVEAVLERKEPEKPAVERKEVPVPSGPTTGVMIAGKVLDAYVSRDDERMLELLVEVGKL